MLNFPKCMFLIGLGVGGTLMYQKYSKPAMRELEKIMDQTVKKVNQELDEMM